MIRTCFALGMVILLVEPAAAQQPSPAIAPPPVRSLPAASRREIDPDGNDEIQYVVEFKILEQKGSSDDNRVGRHASADVSLVERLQKLADRSTETTSNTAVLPSPQRIPPTATAAPPATTKKSAGDELWEESALRSSKKIHNWNPADGKEELWEESSLWSPEITTIAAPKLTILIKEPITLQIQSAATLTYLAPLGDGKYQTKRMPKQELGMKITVVVQPVDGDDASVELSPLEIQITALDGREPVEGLDLDVGKPIISTRSLKTTAKMKLGAVRMIAIPSGPNTQAALLMRVKQLQFTAPQQE